MAKSLSLLVSAVAVLLQLGSAAVLDQQKLVAQQLSAQNLLSQKMYGHLQVEIDEWNRLGYPDVLHFNDGDAGARITEMPLLTSMLFPNYEKGTKFYLYTRDNRNGTKVGTTPTAKDFLEAGFSAGRPTKIVAHGWGNNIDSTIFQEVVPSLLDNDDYNVIAIDWGELAKMPLYIESRNHVAGVGKQVAKAVDELVANGGLNLKDTHCLGHSLGAHVCGNTGKNVQSGKLNRITGLDPAMPLFLVLKNDRLGKGDAELVDVIHTCAGLLGIVEAIGDVDFYPNGGSLPQPGCESELLASSCSHSRSFEYMAESAREPGSFPAYECDSSSEARRGDCAGDLVANMGLNLNYDGPGSYYLKTADSAPFDIQTHLRVEASKKVEG